MVIMVPRLAHSPVNRDAAPIGGTATMGVTAIFDENRMAGKSGSSLVIGF